MAEQLPDVNITEQNGQTGAVEASADHIYGLVLSSAVAPTGLALSTPKHVNSLAEIVALGITAAFDTTNATDCYQQLSDFYAEAGDGIDLWFMIIPKTVLLETACDKTQDIVKKLLNAADGSITLWGINRTPDGAYAPTYANAIDPDVTAAIAKAQALCEEFRDTEKSPCRAIIGGREFQTADGIGGLADLTQRSDNRVQICLWSKYSSGNPSVGFLLGRYANRPIQRKVSRVKDGDLGIAQGYLTDGSTVETFKSAWQALANKGYVFVRKFKRKTGYFISTDKMACSTADDYADMTNGLVMDKLYRVVYDTYVDELEDDLELDVNGYIAPEVAKDIQNTLERALRANLVDTGNASDVRVELDPAQNIIANGGLTVKKAGCIPKGYTGFIDIEIGFYNPANE